MVSYNIYTLMETSEIYSIPFDRLNMPYQHSYYSPYNWITNILNDDRQLPEH